MNATVRHRALVVLLVFSAACGSSGPSSSWRPSRSTSPTPTPQPPVLPAPPPPSTFPPLSGPSRTFIFDHPLSNPVADYTKNSRFVLYDDGAFVLQYVGLTDYRGGYTVANGVITFAWEGWSAAGPWGATGVLNGDSLTVQYNGIMQMTDFEDAVYVLTH